MTTVYGPVMPGFSLKPKARYVAELASIAGMHENGIGPTEDPLVAGPERHSDMVATVHSLTSTPFGPCDDAMAAVAPLRPGVAGNNFQVFKSDMEFITDEMDKDSWGGAAAVDFRRFTTKFDDIADNQAAMADELYVAADGYRTGLQEVWDVTDEALDKTIEALNAVIADSEAASKTLGISVVKVVIGVASTIASGGTAVALGFAALNTSIATAEAVSASIGGRKVEDIMSNLDLALSKISTELETVEEHLIEVLSKDYELISQGENRPTQVPDATMPVFELPRPQLAD